MNDKVVTFLLVEDDEVDVEAIKRAFRKKKIANPLLVAGDGIIALQMLRGEDGHRAVPRPYLLLVDLNMPRMNGLELIRELRSDPDLRDSAIFVLTTSQHDEDRVAVYGLNVCGYIVKTNVAHGFLELVELFDYYSRIVELP